MHSEVVTALLSLAQDVAALAASVRGMGLGEQEGWQWQGEVQLVAAACADGSITLLDVDAVGVSRWHRSSVSVLASFLSASSITTVTSDPFGALTVPLPGTFTNPRAHQQQHCMTELVNNGFDKYGNLRWCKSKVGKPSKPGWVDKRIRVRGGKGG